MKKFLITLFIITLCSNVAFAKVQETQKFEQSEQYQEISNQINILYAGNDTKNAFDLLLTIPENERSAQNYLLLGNILQEQGKTDEATFMYQKAVQIDEDFYKAYYNLGNIYLSEGKPNMAIEQYKKVVKIKPEYAYAHYNIACAYIKLGKYTKAKYELLTAIDLKNTVADFHYNLAYVYKQLGKEKEAQKYLDYYNKLEEQCIKE